MQGLLKRKVSIFRGYQEKWFVLEEEGFLKQYEKMPFQDERPVPNWKMDVILADIEKKKDGLQFYVISNEGQTVKLKAESSEKRDEWIHCCFEITKKRFSALYKYGLQKEDKATAHVTVITPESLPETPHEKRFDENKDCSGSVSPQQKPKLPPKVPPKLPPKLPPKPPILKELNKDYDIVAEEDKQPESREDILNKFKNMTIVSKRKNKLMVAAIDFGSAYSGCAFSFNEDFDKNPLEIHIMPLNKSFESHKVPTILLLDPEGKFKAFGSEAEEIYAALLDQEPEKAKDYYYFSRFKMQLYNNMDLKKSMLITDISGQKKMKAVDVFAYCIEYIKDSVFGRAKEHASGLEEKDVHWVLTVPAIWNEAARQFMIDSAEKAGIDSESLTLALEPEAAALCCKYLEIQKQDKGQEAMLRSFETGSRFLIIDLGGGTVDITSNEVLETGQLKEIYSASGGPWGGNTINAEFWAFLRKLFGSDVVETFLNNNRDDYLYMAKQIESKKRGATIRNRITLDIPHSLLELVKKSNPAIVSEKYSDIVKAEGSKIIIEPGVIYEIFKSGIDAICNYVQDLVNKPETAGVSTFLLVGEYASCDLLKDAIRERFQNHTVICPLNSDLIVLKGAVIMGHLDRPIIGRMAKCHYGFAVVKNQRAFGRSFTPLTRMPEFIPFIRKGQPIKVNEVVSEFDVPIAFDQQEAFIRIYASDDDEPPETINYRNCKKIGHIKINLPRFEKNTTLKIGISNNETEFKVVARDEHTGRCFAGVCRFLNLDRKTTLPITERVCGFDEH